MEAIKYDELILSLELKIINVIPVFKTIEEDLNTKIYLVGGCIRDAIRNDLVSNDIDIVIALSDLTKLSSWLDSNGVSSAINQKKGFQTLTFNIDGTSIDATLIKGDTIEDDAKHRDFCCNAIYVDTNGAIYDPTYRGLSDIENKLIHLTNGTVTLDEDPLRILRAVRFEATKGFKIDGETCKILKSIKKRSFKDEVAVERIQIELRKIFVESFDGKDVVSAINRMKEFGILIYILPEFDEIWGYEQDSKYHEWTLEGHCLRVLEKAFDYATEILSSVEDREIICLAALLHDIAKPETRSWDKKKNVAHYIGHEKASAAISKKILERLKYSKEIVEKTCFIIEHHMDIKQLKNDEGNFRAKPAKFISVVENFKSKKYGNLIYQCCCLIKADDLSHSTKLTTSNVDSFLERYEQGDPKESLKPFKFDGDVIAEKLSISEGPELGEAIKKLNLLRYKYPELSDVDEFVRIYKSMTEDDWKDYLKTIN